MRIQRVSPKVDKEKMRMISLVLLIKVEQLQTLILISVVERAQ
jgi:hypothetical protein